jgi:4-hydroxybenzoate polyprenyltransferase
METNIQHHIGLNQLPFYIIIFFGTVCYYGFIYYKSVDAPHYNDRTLWYRKHLKAIKFFFYLFLIIIVFAIFIWIDTLTVKLSTFTLWQWFLIIIFPLVSLQYTSTILPIAFLSKIRRIGWLKPFVVGFTWTGVVNIFPVLFWHIRHQAADGQPLLPSGIFWLQSFLFVSALAVIFDIKDFRSDVRTGVFTYPARLGVRKTFLYIIFPLIFLSMVCLVIFLQQQAYSPIQIAFQLIPYFVLLILSLNFKKVKDVLFYLVAIDGLMLVKALCGAISVLYL